MKTKGELEAKDYRSRMGFPGKGEFVKYIQRKGVAPPPISWGTINEHAEELCDALKRLNSRVLPPAFRREGEEIDDFLSKEVYGVIKNCRKKKVVERMRNEKRTREDVFVNWLVGRAVAEFFKPAIAKYFAIERSAIRSIGDDDPDSASFRRTGKADLEVDLAGGERARVEVQAALQPVSDIKKHKVENAAQAWDGGKGVATYCFHFDLYNGRMSVVPLHLLDAKETEWVRREAMGVDVVPLGESHVCWVFQNSEMTTLRTEKPLRWPAVDLARSMSKSGPVSTLIDRTVVVMDRKEGEAGEDAKSQMVRAFGGRRGLGRAATLEDAKFALSLIRESGAVQEGHLPSPLLLEAAFVAEGRMGGREAAAVRKMARAEMFLLWERRAGRGPETQMQEARRITLGAVVGTAFPAFGTEEERVDWRGRAEKLAGHSRAIVVPGRNGVAGGVGCRVSLDDVGKAAEELAELVKSTDCPTERQVVEACFLALEGAAVGEVGLSRASLRKLPTAQPVRSREQPGI